MSKLNVHAIQGLIAKGEYAKKMFLGNYTPANWFECDMISVTGKGYATEFEIKLSKADFKSDFKKVDGQYSYWKKHCLGDGGKNKHEWMATDPRSCPIKHFYFVVPEGIIDDSDVPLHCGLILVNWCPSRGVYGKRYAGGYRLKTVRKAPQLGATPLDDKVIEHMRGAFYWRYHKFLSNSLQEANMERNNSQQNSQLS